jgi:hypothetical protein
MSDALVMLPHDGVIESIFPRFEGASDYCDFYLQLTGVNPRLCPRCGAPLIRLLLPRPLPPVVDTS